MKSTGWKDIAELVGVAAIVASLVFVGLQMKQSQEIAIAAQYHNRAALAVEYVGDLMENETIVASGTFESGSLKETLPDASNAARSAAFLALISYHTIGDNHLYQYQAGFLDEESWQARRLNLKNLLRGEPAQVVCLRTAFRASYQDLCKELIAENRGESVQN